MLDKDCSSLAAHLSSSAVSGQFEVFNRRGSSTTPTAHILIAAVPFVEYGYFVSERYSSCRYTIHNAKSYQQDHCVRYVPFDFGTGSDE